MEQELISNMTKVLSDIEIAQQTTLEPIVKIAE